MGAASSNLPTLQESPNNGIVQLEEWKFKKAAFVFTAAANTAGLSQHVYGSNKEHAARVEEHTQHGSSALIMRCSLAPTRISHYETAEH